MQINKGNELQMMLWCSIQGAIPSPSQYSRERLRIRCDPDLNEALWLSESELQIFPEIVWREQQRGSVASRPNGFAPVPFSEVCLQAQLPRGNTALGAFLYREKWTPGRVNKHARLRIYYWRHFCWASSVKLSEKKREKTCANGHLQCLLVYCYQK